MTVWVIEAPPSTTLAVEEWSCAYSIASLFGAIFCEGSAIGAETHSVDGELRKEIGFVELLVEL